MTLCSIQFYSDIKKTKNKPGFRFYNISAVETGLKTCNNHDLVASVAG